MIATAAYEETSIHSYYYILFLNISSVASRCIRHSTAKWLSGHVWGSCQCGGVSVPTLTSPSSANFPLAEKHVPLCGVGDFLQFLWEILLCGRRVPPSPSLQSHHMTPAREKLPVCSGGNWKQDTAQRH